MNDLKHELHKQLQAARANILSKLDGLTEHDMRRPLTATGTNLLLVRVFGDVGECTGVRSSS